jgi:hypothetical protein
MNEGFEEDSLARDARLRVRMLVVLLMGLTRYHYGREEAGEFVSPISFEINVQSLAKSASSHRGGKNVSTDYNGYFC